MLKIVRRQSGLAANMTSYYLDVPFAAPISQGHGKEHMPTSVQTVYFTRAGHVFLFSFPIYRFYNIIFYALEELTLENMLTGYFPWI